MKGKGEVVGGGRGSQEEGERYGRKFADVRCWI